MFQLILAFAFLAVVARVVSNAFKPGLSHIPGPLWVRFSSLSSVFLAKTGRFKTFLEGTHAQYGPVVRTGPNTISISDPSMVEPIFGIKANLIKPSYMSTWWIYRDGKTVPSVVSVRDSKYHAEIRKPINHAYSMTNISTLEPFVNDDVAYFFERLDKEFVQTGRVCDIHKWLQYFGYDTMGDLIFGSRFGYLEAGSDYNHGLKAIVSEMNYRFVVQNAPWLHKLLHANPLYLWLYPSNPLALRARDLLTQRLSSGTPDPTKRDLMATFLDARTAHPETVTDLVFTGYMTTPIAAGADTTATVLRSILYYVLRDPRVHAKLVQELDASGLALPLAPYKVLTSLLPYFEAIVREAMRVHFGISSDLQRVVPASGLALPDGSTLPPGTIVGMSAHDVGRDRGVFGADAAVFRPERWLQGGGGWAEETDAVFAARVGAMNRADLSWGFGIRGCLGKNIARMEIFKVVPTLFWAFEMELVHDRGWTVDQGFFTTQSDMDIRIRWRQGKSLASVTVE